MAEPDQPPTSDQLDEQWLAEWIAYGMGELAYYLLKQARFAQYLERHPTREQDA